MPMTGDIQAIKKLTDLGGDINTVDTQKTAQCAAIILRDAKAYNTLIAAGIIASYIDREIRTKANLTLKFMF